MWNNEIGNIIKQKSKHTWSIFKQTWMYMEMNIKGNMLKQKGKLGSSTVKAGISMWVTMNIMYAEHKVWLIK